jgi:hypothetical protein
MLLLVFLGSIFTPQGNDWTGNFSSLFNGNGWILDNASIIKQITHAGIKEKIAMTTDINLIAELKDKIFYANLARIILISLFVYIGFMVYFAFLKRSKEGRVTI